METVHDEGREWEIQMCKKGLFTGRWAGRRVCKFG